MTKTIREPARPHALLDHAREIAGVTNDRELADRLHLSCPVISKVRSGDLKAGATMLVRMHEMLGVSFPTMRALLKQARAQG